MDAMVNYSEFLTYGDFIPLSLRCDVNKLFKEIKDFKFSQYNPRKNIPRYGLSITSIDGKVNGINDKSKILILLDLLKPNLTSRTSS